MSQYKYLDKLVVDRGQKGLDTKREFLDIIRAILHDYETGKINKKTAMGRLLLLYRLTYKKNNRKLRIVQKTRIRLRKLIKEAMSSL